MVPVVDLSRRGARFAARFVADAERILAGGQLLLGPELDRFETALARETGAEHAVGVASGAAAIQLGLAALGVGVGDEVVVPGFTAVPTASAVAATGATPVFADVDPYTGCLDRDAVEAAVTASTAAIVVVHLYGYPSELPPAVAPIVEDAAQAHGALDDHGRSALTAYSFYPTKNLGGIGDGGAVVTRHAELAERVRRLRAHGMTEQYVHELVSQNFRMSELEAAWLAATLPALHDDVARRRAIAACYRAAAPGLRWQAPHERHGYHLCVFRSEAREDVRSRLAAAGVATAVHYPLALTQQPAYRSFRSDGCHESERWAAECVTVPCFPELTDGEVEIVSSALSGVQP